MTFEETGQSADDRLARQLEIYRAVAPLLLTIGVRHLSMRQAAQAAHLSIGDLYHYFSTRQELALFAIQPRALARRGQNFQQQALPVASSNPATLLESFYQRFVNYLLFMRPSVRAALDLGMDVTTEVEGALKIALQELTEALPQIMPHMEGEQLQEMERSLRHFALTALLEGRETSQDILNEFRLLVEGHHRWCSYTWPDGAVVFERDEAVRRDVRS